MPARTSDTRCGRRVKIKPQHDPEGVELRVQGGGRYGHRAMPSFEMEVAEIAPTGRLGGTMASRLAAGRRHARDQVREKDRIAAATPKNIEAALAEARARNKRRRHRASGRGCPNPVRLARQFVSDPVTRFWLGCNIFCVLLLLLMTFLFLSFLYPLVFRPIFKY